MDLTQSNILVINGGSSSIKFAVYQDGPALNQLLGGSIERIGTADAALAMRRCADEAPDHTYVGGGNRGTGAAGEFLLDYLARLPEFELVHAVGHRVVHGLGNHQPQRVTPVLLEQLRGIVAFDPNHLPEELRLMELLQARHPELPQMACFDTAFHHSMPSVATMLPIPRKYAAQGVQRYGFHGLSYAYLMEELRRLGDRAAVNGRVILAHLGNGASMAAVRNGQSIDTSMGFTPAAGLVMSTRSGDVDPGLMNYFARAAGMTPGQIAEMTNKQSGLLGISETSGDVRDLLAAEAADPRAAQALDAFCYSAKKYIGAYAAALGGLDTLVFAGGIGENSPIIRERICQRLEFLGVELDPVRNAAGAPLISLDTGRVSVRIIHTKEELMIARFVSRILKQHEGIMHKDN